MSTFSNKILTISALSLSVLCSSMTANAAFDTDYRDIDAMGAYNGGMFLTLVGADLDPECARTLFINETDANYKTKVATLLTAKALETRVLVNFDAPTPGSGCPLTLNRFLIE